jgi:hypothetical protein
MRNRTRFSEDGDTTLRHSSGVYWKYEGDIDHAINMAMELKILGEDVRDQIFRDDEIVCERAKGDDRPSVTRLFYATAKWTTREHARMNESADPNYVPPPSPSGQLVHDTLALRFCIRDETEQYGNGSAEDRLAHYRTLIRELEEHCIRSKIPSILPSLYTGRDILSILGKPEYVIDENNPGRHQMHTILANLLATQDPHFALILIRLGISERSGEMLDLIEMAATRRNMTLPELYCSNTMITANAVMANFLQKNYETVLEICNDLGIGVVLGNAVLCEKYIRSLIETERMQDAMTFLNAYGTSLDLENRHVSKTFWIACEQIGWWLYGTDRAKEGLAFIQQHAGHELDGQRGRTNMQELAKALETAIRNPGKAAARVAALKAEANGKNGKPDTRKNGKR